MELADILVVTKDDGDNRQRAAAHCQELKMVLTTQSPTPGLDALRPHLLLPGRARTGHH